MSFLETSSEERRPSSAMRKKTYEDQPSKSIINLNLKTEEDDVRKVLVASLVPSSRMSNRMLTEDDAIKSLNLLDLQIKNEDTIEEISNKIFYLEREISDLTAR